MEDHGVFSVVPRLPAGSLLAELSVGETTPSLFPPLLRFGGPGAPPPTAAEVNTGLPPVTLEKTPWSLPGQSAYYLVLSIVISAE